MESDGEQFTAFVDILGFSESVKGINENTKSKVLDLLKNLSALSGDFEVEPPFVRPAISTFSDTIVISYPIQANSTEPGSVICQFRRLLAAIAAKALRLGFLVRGGATIGSLYHAGGVVFGEALVDAFEIEKHTSVYPRVVLSQKITRRSEWIKEHIVKDNDGLYHVDYFKELLWRCVDPRALNGLYYGEAKAWFDDVVDVVSKNLTTFESSGKLKELSKWTWFSRKFQAGLERIPSGLLREMGICLDVIPWSK